MNLPVPRKPSDLLPGNPFALEPPVPRFLIPKLEALDETPLPALEVAFTSSTEAPITKPGCTAANEAGVALFHLMGLSRNWGGRGVLYTTPHHLERAAKAAEIAQAPDVAARLREVSSRLPEVQSPEDAAALSEDLWPIARETWDLAVKCGQVTSEMWRKAQELGLQVSEGKLSREEAVVALRQVS